MGVLWRRRGGFCPGEPSVDMTPARYLLVSAQGYLCVVCIKEDRGGQVPGRRWTNTGGREVSAVNTWQFAETPQCGNGISPFDPRHHSFRQKQQQQQQQPTSDSRHTPLLLPHRLQFHL